MNDNKLNVLKREINFIRKNIVTLLDLSISFTF